MASNSIIYGKDSTEKIVNLSVMDDTLYIYQEIDGNIIESTRPYTHWVLSKKKHNDTFTTLEGNQPFKYFKEYKYADFEAKAKPLVYKLGLFTIQQKQENYMVRHGITYFKNTKVDEVSLLSFDIETTGLDPKAPNAKLLIITNTFRKLGNYESKTFVVDDFSSEKEMILAWAEWVKEKDPSVIIGHNIIMFDIPYIIGRCSINKIQLKLGRRNQPLQIEDRERQFRKDGSQSYTYKRIECFGREIIDTFFLAIKTDIGRVYPTYGIKSIMKYEGLEEDDRQHYEAAKIAQNWHIPEEKKKIIAYAEADSRDPIKLYDLKIATMFYICPVIPKPFQLIAESASGSQLNALMVRSYLQQDHSIAEAEDVPKFQGAISFGVPGVYKNMLKLDFSALYPSIMREYELYDKKKDPKKHFLQVVEFFHEYRQEYKKKYQETKDRYYDDLQNVAKTIANSCYGFLAAKGLQYNSPQIASFITAKARELLTFSIEYFSSRSLNSWIEEFREKTGFKEKEEKDWNDGVDF